MIRRKPSRMIVRTLKYIGQDETLIAQIAETEPQVIMQCKIVGLNFKEGMFTNQIEFLV